MIKLYVTDWAPNGTNDLLITEAGMILDYLPEATFGINVTKCTNKALLLEGSDCLADVDIELSESEEETLCILGEVSLATVQKHLAVSPCLDRAEARKRLMNVLVREVA